MRRVSVRQSLAGVVSAMVIAIWATAAFVSIDDASAQSGAASRLHADALVLDGHVHTINRVYWEGIDPWKAQTTGLHDYARAKQAGVDAVIEQLYVQDAYNDYNVMVKQACRLIETFYRVLESNRDKMELALTAADVRRIAASGKLAVILALEGGFDLEGDLDVLRLFHRLGVRLIQFTNHNTTNAFVDAGTGAQKWNGINDRGREIIAEMNRLGIIIDISHASDSAQLQIIQASRAPVAASHHGLRHFNPDSPRALADEVLKALAAKGGLMGVHTMATFLSPAYLNWSRNRRPSGQPTPQATKMQRSPDQDYGAYITALDTRVRQAWREDFGKPWREEVPADVPLPTVNDWAENAAYVVSVAGEDYVGMGTDMMDGRIASRHGAPNLRDFDATGYPRLTEAMVNKGLAPGTIRKILGENWLRLLDAVTKTANEQKTSPR
jgi:membrane dipeptidase